MNDLPFALDRNLLIRARRETVFRFFSESALFARWWGSGSTIDARPGGLVRIVYPDSRVASGEVVEVEPQRRIVFTYGYEYADAMIPPGGSRVHITLEDHADGTLVALHHEVTDAATRDAHIAGWRYQLALFANVAAAVEHERLDSIADDWFQAWNTTEQAARVKLLARCTSDRIAFRDNHSCGQGRDELNDLIAQSQLHMPGMTIRREGTARQCQGTAMIDWLVLGPGAAPVAKGTNVVRLAADGRIADSVGFWAR